MDTLAYVCIRVGCCEMATVSLFHSHVAVLRSGHGSGGLGHHSRNANQIDAVSGPLGIWKVVSQVSSVHGDGLAILQASDVFPVDLCELEMVVR